MRIIIKLIVVCSLLALVFAEIPDIELALKANDYEKALYLSKQAFYQNNKNPLAEIYYYLGVSYAKLQRNQLADEAFDNFFKNDFYLDQAYLVAEFYKNSDNTARAINAYRAIVTRYDEQQVAMEELGVLYYKQGDYQNAVNLLTKIISAQPEKANPFAYYLGISYDRLKESDQADKYLKMANTAGYDEPELHFVMGKNYLNKGKHQQALDELLKGVNTTLETVSPEIYFQMASAYYKLAQYPEAEEASKKALDGGYQNSAAYLVFGNSALRNNHYRGITETLEPQREAHINNSKYLNLLATAYEYLGNYNKAISYYQSVIALDPESEGEIRPKLDVLRDAQTAAENKQPQ